MGKKKKKKAMERKASPKSIRELIGRFKKPSTSEEEALGLLNFLTRYGSKFEKGEMTFKEFGSMIKFLCEIGNEVELHHSVAKYPELRKRARIVLSRHVLIEEDSRVFFSLDKEANESQIYAPLYRFYAASKDHCRLNDSEREVVRKFFDPFIGGKLSAGEPQAFCKALINLGVIDILEGHYFCFNAIPLLYEEFGDFFEKQNIRTQSHHTPDTLSWDGWREMFSTKDRLLYQEVLRSHLKVESPLFEVSRLEHDFDSCVRRSGFIITMFIKTSRSYEKTILKNARILLSFIALFQREYHETRIRVQESSKST